MAVSELDHLDTILLFSFKRFESIPGKKALQKLVYLLKESGLSINFEFQWDKYGPYSPELATYVEDLVAEGLMESEAKKVLVTSEEDRGVQYSFRLKDRATELLSSERLSADEESKIGRVIGLYKEIGPHNLELYATVHYVAKFFSTDRERTRFPDGLFELVNDYKPNRFREEQVKAAYYNMKNLRWLPT